MQRQGQKQSNAYTVNTLSNELGIPWQKLFRITQILGNTDERNLQYPIENKMAVMIKQILLKTSIKNIENVKKYVLMHLIM